MRKENKGLVVEQLKGYLNEYPHFYQTNIDKKEESKLRLKAAYAETGFYGADQLAELVAIKSKEELIADVVALLQSPIRNVVSALENKDKAEEAAAE